MKSFPINIRMVVFAAVIMLLVGYPLYLYVDTAVSGGVKDAGDGKTKVVESLQAMSTFDFDQVNGRTTDVPQKWRELDGKRVVLYGEMWAPSSAGNKVETFDLCYSISKCCFTGPPLVQHFVKSKGPSDRVGYYSGLVKVIGTLHVGVEQGDDKVASIYRMDVESVDPVR